MLRGSRQLVTRKLATSPTSPRGSYGETGPSGIWASVCIVLNSCRLRQPALKLAHAVDFFSNRIWYSLCRQVSFLLVDSVYVPRWRGRGQKYYITTEQWHWVRVFRRKLNSFLIFVSIALAQTNTVLVNRSFVGGNIDSAVFIIVLCCRYHKLPL